MNFNIYVEDNLATQLDRLAKQQGKKRNTIIREALEAWTARHLPTTWHEDVLAYTGSENSIVFEAYRDELLPPKEPEL